jgi:hypothetical protein
MCDMKPKKTPKTRREIEADRYAKAKAAGKVRVAVMAHPEDAKEIRNFARALTQKRDPEAKKRARKPITPFPDWL